MFDLHYLIGIQWKYKVYETFRKGVGLLVLLLGLFSSGNAIGQDLKKHKWNNRVLVVKTQNENTERYRKQRHEFQDKAKGFIERRLVLYAVANDKCTYTDYKNKIVDSTVQKTLANHKFFHINKNNTFEILLIGLDGRIKLQQSKLLTTKQLFEIIDAMPMRSRELKN